MFYFSIEFWQIKLPVVISLSFLWEWICSIVAFYGKTDSALVGGALILLCLDFVLGVRASLKRGEKFSSTGLRQTVSKVVGYVGFCLSTIVVSNTLSSTMLNPITEHLGTMSIVYIIITELWSCIENALGYDKAVKALKTIANLLGGKFTSITDIPKHKNEE